jgi:ribonuclease P protein component
MNIRHSDEFRRVYAQGKRYDGHFMTAFLYPNRLLQHRLGITASRKAIGNAVERNRSKRLLREAFRLSSNALDELAVKYDLVLNAKRRLLVVSLAEPLGEFQKIVASVARDEHSVLMKAERLEP